MSKPTALLLVTLLMAGCGQAAPFARPLQAKPFAAKAAKGPDPAKFFARPEVQAQAPEAFSTQPAALGFHAALDAAAPGERDALVAAIQKNPALKAGVAKFASLAWDQKLPLIKALMTLECELVGAKTPPLVIEKGVDARAAFFEFDPAVPGTGRVMLGPDALDQETNPYAALLLALHETRHSAQFQLAFKPGAAGPLASGFAASFKAQKALSGKLTFCDFLSLNNEFEAFQSANYVLGKLTGWTVDTTGMGCLSSQYDAHGHLLLDLPGLAKEVGPANMLAAFNEREKVQFKEMGGR